MNEGHRLRRKEPRVSHVIVDDAVKHLFLIITWERRLKKNTEQHRFNTLLEDSVLPLVLSQYRYLGYHVSAFGLNTG